MSKNCPVGKCFYNNEHKGETTAAKYGCQMYCEISVCELFKAWRLYNDIKEDKQPEKSEEPSYEEMSNWFIKMYLDANQKITARRLNTVLYKFYGLIERKIKHEMDKQNRF